MTHPPATPAAPAPPAPVPGYPIVEMRDLQRPARSGPLKLLPRARHDLPRPREGHFVLVYKVDNGYVVDRMSRGPRDDKVVNASQVTVVDLAKKTPVEVELTIPSRDHAFFTVVVTFECSVDDPVAVVEGGITDPGRVLLTYLKNHHGYSQMGLGFRIGQVNEARLYINAQLTAYATVNEPEIDGMTVTMASVEVRTPASEQAKADHRRSMLDQHVIKSEQVDLETELKSHQQDREHVVRRGARANEHELQVTDLDNRHELRMAGLSQDQDYDVLDRRHRHLVEDEDRVRRIKARRVDRLAEDEERRHVIEARRLELEAELDRMGMTERYRLQGLRESAELLSDPTRALELAYLSGQITATELAERVQHTRERSRGLEQAAADRRYEAEQQRRRDESADRHEQRAFDRELKREELAARRAEAERAAEQARLEREVERERERARMIWQRADELAEREASQERERRVYQAKVDMGKAIVDRGLLDSSSVNLEEIVRLDSGGLPLFGAPEALPDQPARDEPGTAEGRDGADAR